MHVSTEKAPHTQMRCPEHSNGKLLFSSDQGNLGLKGAVLTAFSRGIPHSSL
jgi:hypothetical protein